MRNVAIIGAGQIGSCILQYLAMNGINVTLIDYKESNVSRASDVIESSLNRLSLKEKISEENLIEVKKIITIQVLWIAVAEWIWL